MVGDYRTSWGRPEALSGYRSRLPEDYPLKQAIRPDSPLTEALRASWL